MCAPTPRVLPQAKESAARNAANDADGSMEKADSDMHALRKMVSLLMHARNM